MSQSQYPQLKIMRAENPFHVYILFNMGHARFEYDERIFEVSNVTQEGSLTYTDIRKERIIRFDHLLGVLIFENRDKNCIKYFDTRADKNPAFDLTSEDVARLIDLFMVDAIGLSELITLERHWNKHDNLKPIWENLNRTTSSGMKVEKFE